MDKLTKEEILKMLKENPDELIKHLDKRNINLEKFGQELDIAKKLVKEEYQINDTNIQAVEFVFWLSYFVERSARDFIVEPEVQIGSRKETIQLLVDKLSFGDKISILSKLHLKSLKKDKLESLLWKINELRNAVSHGRFEELKYEGYKLSNVGGQLKIISDLMSGLLENN